MATYPLQAMLRVRGLHEDQAKRAAHEADERLRAAEEERNAQVAELERYRLWRPAEEDRRYAAIFGTSMKVGDLGSFREQLALLAQGEADRALRVKEAESVVASRRQEAEAARQAVIMARKASMKLEEHRNLWMTAERKEEERVADLELEESRGPARSSDES